VNEQERTDGRARAHVLADGLGPADVALVHREALCVLRPVIDTAFVDAYSDAPWPPEVLPSHATALRLAGEEKANGTRTRRADPGMGIGIDVRDDDGFGVLADLSPYTICAEGWSGDRLVFGADDSGASLWLWLTPRQEADLLARLAVRGIPRTALAEAPPVRR
jgi:hypothetical protein